MKTIFKYPLQITDEQEIELPALSEILTVQVQSGNVCLWAMVDSNAYPETRLIEIIGTGDPVLSGNLKYISTIQFENKDFVFHVFERLNYKE